MKFANMNSVYDYCTELNSKWEGDIVPSILQYSKELGMVLPVSTCENGEYTLSIIKNVSNSLL